MGAMDAAFSSTSHSPDNLIAGNKPPAKAVPITLTDGEDVVRGELLGFTTATGKYLASLNAATDGSEIASAIAAVAAAPSGADETILAYVQGEFNQDEVTFPTGQTVANTKEDLRQVGIFLVDPVTKTPA
jgi:hypothetical protein